MCGALCDLRPPPPPSEWRRAQKMLLQRTTSKSHIGELAPMALCDIHVAGCGEHLPAWGLGDDRIPGTDQAVRGGRHGQKVHSGVPPRGRGMPAAVRMPAGSSEACLSWQKVQRREAKRRRHRPTEPTTKALCQSPPLLFSNAYLTLSPGAGHTSRTRGPQGTAVGQSTGTPPAASRRRRFGIRARRPCRAAVARRVFACALLQTFPNERCRGGGPRRASEPQAQVRPRVSAAPPPPLSAPGDPLHGTRGDAAHAAICRGGTPRRTCWRALLPRDFGYPPSRVQRTLLINLVRGLGTELINESMNS